MSKDVIIIPSSGSIDFKESDESKIRLELEADGNLSVFGASDKILTISDQDNVVGITGSIVANRVEYDTGFANIVTTGSITSGIFNSTELIYPTIPPDNYSGAHIEYTAQREGAVRSGIILASWSGSVITHTDVSNTDIGDSSDLSFNVVFENSNIRLRAYSAGSGSGEWIIYTLFKLFPNLL